MAILHDYQNGNANIVLHDDGTRIINFPDGEALQPEYPFNIDIRVSNECAFGSGVVCGFCHESATQYGETCDYDWLYELLANSGLPKGTELAIGANHVKGDFYVFCQRVNDLGYIINLTVNLGLIKSYRTPLRLLLKNNIVKGLGISYRKEFQHTLDDILVSDIVNYENAVLHVIAGIDDAFDIVRLHKKVNKILILGEKDFGFNEGQVDLESKSHKTWYNQLGIMLQFFDVVSFDNLAVEQLKPQRFVSVPEWNVLYQGEYSFYINAVERYFAPSSRSSEKTFDTLDVRKYFSTLVKLQTTIDQ